MSTCDDVNVQTPRESDLGEQSSQEDPSDMDLDVIDQPSTSSMSRDHAKEMCASIIAKLQGSGVANNVVLSVVESMEEYVKYEVHADLLFLHLLLLLLHIINIVFSPCIKEGMLVFLKHLIEEHHRLFTHLYPQNNSKNITS